MENAATIQGELENALYKMTGETLRVMAASRTDAGVHALGQVASFRTGSGISARAFVSGLNYYLPPDIAVEVGRPVGTVAFIAQPFAELVRSK
jgi:tRNA pseudouridine38-40 synthase